MNHVERTRTGRAWIVVMVLAAAWLAACTGGRNPSQPEKPAPAGDPERGREVLNTYGCGTCHTIPGVTSADAWVGPPLTAWAERRYIAGTLANTPENLVRWILDPQAVEPGTAMPDAGVSEEDARDMSAFLYTLRKDDQGSWR